MRIDLHMHSAVSGGTDTPEKLPGNVRQAGIQLFALGENTHDDTEPMPVGMKRFPEDVCYD